MTYRQLLAHGITLFRAAGFEEAMEDARELLYDACALTAQSYLMRSEEEASLAEEERTKKSFERRLSGEPVQYIRGTAPFFGRMFCVSPNVLIPRFDTEVLVTETLSRLPDEARVLDLCTGCGCVLLTILLEASGTSGVGTDLSRDALTVAKENAKSLGAQRYAFYEGDLFSALPDEERYDAVVSNPPYIESRVIDKLEREIRDFEPRMALDGGEDGLLFYRRILSDAKSHLRPGGFCAVEIGKDQGERVADLFRNAGFSDTIIRKDLNGLDRVVIGYQYV